MTDLIERLLNISDIPLPPPPSICLEAAAAIKWLRAALRPFAEVPPHSPPSRRLLVADAGTGPYHFLQSDLDQAKEVYRALEQSAAKSVI